MTDSNKITPDRKSLRAYLAEHRRDALIVLVLSLATLVYLAFHALLLWRWAPYVDEDAYSLLAQQALDNPAVRWAMLLDNKGPLLTWLSFLPMRLGVDNPLTALRLVVIGAGMLTIGATGLIARHIADTRTAVLTVGLLVLSPLLIVHTSMGMHEPLVMATAMTALYLQLRIAERPRLDHALLLGAALALGLLTKEGGKLTLLLTPLSLLAFDWRQPQLAKRLFQWVGCMAVAGVVAWIGFSVEKVSPDYYSPQRSVAANVQYHSPGFALSHFDTIFNANWPMLQAALVGYLSVPLVILMAIGFGVWIRHRPRQTILLLAWIVLPVGAAVLIATKPLIRYLLPAAPLLVLFIAVGLVSVGDFAVGKAREHKYGALIVSVVAIFVFLPTVLFDARLLKDPETVELPAYEDRELIVDASSGTPCRDMANTIKADRRGRPVRGKAVVIAKLSGPATCLDLLLNNGVRNHKYLNVSLEQPAARQARFVVTNGTAMPRRCPNEAGVDNCAYLRSKRLQVVTRYRRPRGGDPLYMYRVAAS